MPRPRQRSTPLIVLLVGAAVLLGLAGVEGRQTILAPALLGLFLLLLTLGLLRFQKDPASREFVTRLVLAGIAVRFVLLFLVHQTVGPYGFAPDAYTYEIVGQKVADAWSSGGPLPPEVRESFQVGYVMVNGALFWLFGHSPVAPAVLNIFFGAWLGVPVYYLALAVTPGDRRVARWAAALAVFFPSLVLWSILNIRDTPTILILVTIVYLLVRFQERVEARHVMWALVALAILALFREYLFVLVTLSGAGGIIIARGRSPVRALVQGAFVLLAAALLYQAGGLGGTVVQEASFETLELYRQDLARRASSAYGLGHDVSTPLGALVFLPVGLTYFLLAPFPWAVSSLLQATTIPETLLWYGLIPFSLWGMYLALKHDPRSYMVVFSVLIVVTLSYALVEGNIGTAYRHRAQILPFIFVFTALGIRDYRALRARKREARRERRRRALERISRAGSLPGPGG